MRNLSFSSSCIDHILPKSVDLRTEWGTSKATTTVVRTIIDMASHDIVVLFAMATILY
jgi:hypothetical protein